MHIKKQRLLTPGPTPLYPKALQAMMGSDIHHRTEDFRNLYKTVLADLKEVMGTQNDILCLVASGSGAMEASVTNLFSKGDKVIVCSAGKFGERWAEITKAFGLDSVVLSTEYGDVISAKAVAEALAANPDAKGVFVQASETSTGASHDIKGMAEAVKKTAGDPGGRCHHRPGHADSRHRRLGYRRGHRRLAEVVHDSSRPRFHVPQCEGVGPR